MKINKKYLYKYLKLYTSDYKLKDCFFCCHNGYARLSTSCGFYPEYYITCIFNTEFDIYEIRVHRNVYDDFGDVYDTLIGKFCSHVHDCIILEGQGWRDLL